jgi:hypothetical protein
MPEAADEHDDEEVDMRSRRTLAVPAERHVEIIAGTRRQRICQRRQNSGDRLRFVRRVEVLGNMNHHQTRPIAMSE